MKSTRAYCYDSEKEYIDAVGDFLSESNAIEGIHSEEALSDAKTAWYWLTAQKNLTMSNICKVQKILTLHQPEIRPNQRGYLREQQVWVGGREGMHWPFIRENLERWLKEANKKEYPIGDHVAFEKIHPFIDGNGRTGRILMNWQFLMKGKRLVIFRASERDEYYQLFKDM
jgi:Fic family protein